MADFCPLQDFGLGNCSQPAPTVCSKEVREKLGFISIFYFFCFEKGDEQVVKHKKITANPKQQTSQVNDFGVSLYMLLFSHQDLSDFFATP